MNTPIDPTDEKGLRAAFARAAVASPNDPFAGMLAVARAVCPEHHVVVPVDEIEKALEIMVWGSSGTRAEQDTMAYFRSLIPAESEAV